MRKRIVLLVAIILSLVTVNAIASVPSIYLIPIQGTIEPGLAEFVERGLKEAIENEAKAVVLQIDTFGGRVDAATEIRDLIMSAPMPVIAYVQDRAWSAGALISLAADKLVMSPHSTLGAAEPRPAEEKVISALRAEFEATAQGRGRDPQVAAAMVDKDIAIPGLVEAGKILTLSAVDAEQIGFIDLISSSQSEMLEFFGLGDARMVLVEPNWAEKLARYVTEPTISSILLTIGFLGLVMELFTVGFGFAGVVGLLSLGLFFGGRLIAGLAGLETIVLFIIGMILLAVEVFVTPGFGAAGFAGLVAVFGSIATSYANARTAAYSLSVALVLTSVGLVVIFRYFKKSRVWNKLILQTKQESISGYVSTDEKKDYLGKQGITLTACRPAGTIMVDDIRLDAVSEGPYISANVPVVVVGISGAQVVVRESKDTDTNSRKEGI